MEQKGTWTSDQTQSWVYFSIFIIHKHWLPINTHPSQFFFIIFFRSGDKRKPAAPPPTNPNATLNKTTKPNAPPTQQAPSSQSNKNITKSHEQESSSQSSSGYGSQQNSSQSSKPSASSKSNAKPVRISLFNYLVDFQLFLSQTLSVGFNLFNSCTLLDIKGKPNLAMLK